MREAVIDPFSTKHDFEAALQRLGPALSSLQTALQDQQQALDDMCFAMAVLKMGVSGFSMVLGNYHQGIRRCGQT